jgi:hypothetical protein
MVKAKIINLSRGFIMILKLEIKFVVSTIEIFLIRRVQQILTPRKYLQLQELKEEVIILMT